MVLFVGIQTYGYEEKWGRQSVWFVMDDPEIMIYE